MLRDHGCINPTTDIELGTESHKIGGAGVDQIIQDLIGNVFVKGALVTIRPDVEFEGLEFDTQLIRNILQFQCSEVRLSS